MDQLPLLRRARPDDLDDLIGLCRVCALGPAPWALPRFVGRRWWREAIRFRPGAVWVAETLDGHRPLLIACCVMGFDEELWRARKAARRSRPLILAGLALRPAIAFAILRNRLARRRIAAIAAKRRHDRPPETTADASAPEAPASASKCAWLDLLAVHPDAWGSGLAQRLMIEAENAARDAGCNAVRLIVEDRNVRAQRFYAKLAYDHVGDWSGRRLLAKTLSPESAPCDASPLRAHDGSNGGAAC